MKINELSKILFNEPCILGGESQALEEVIRTGKFSGDGPFTKRCQAELERRTGSPRALLTTSCTDALEMAAILLDIQPGDEVIAPSYTFVSSVNAFVLRGARIKFIDVEPRTMNLDPRLIEGAISPKTKAIVVVHYGGVACEMDRILEITKKHGIAVVEDAAQAVMATYRGKALGALGDLGCFSFHETKNYNAGEGGALLANRAELVERAEIIREKGTNRSKFYRGQVDKYTWVDIGSSFLISELNAAFLLPQLLEAEKINDRRRKVWSRYFEAFQDLEKREAVELPLVPGYARHNGHLFFLKLRDMSQRTRLIEHLKELGIMAVFHYVPLHSSPAGRKYSEFVGEDRYTTRESERLLRLPLFYNLDDTRLERVIEAVLEFFSKRK